MGSNKKRPREKLSIGFSKNWPSKLYTVGVPINKLLIPILMMVLVSVSSSCGLKGPTAPASERNSFSLRELQCDKDQNFNPTQSYLEIKKRVDELDLFLELYNKHPERETVRFFRPMVGLSEQSTSPGDPLIIGESENLVELSRLDQEWAHSVGEGTWFSFLSNEKAELKLEGAIDPDEVNDLLRDYNRLLDNASRWNYLQCNLANLENKKKLDVRPYLAYVNFKSSHCAVGDQCSEEELSFAKDELINLCSISSSSSSRYICSLEFEQHKRAKSLKEFEEHYFQKQKSKYDSFFQINVLNQWSCHDRLGKTVVEIPYFLNNTFLEKIDHDTDFFEGFVERRWGEGEVQIKLIKSDAPSENAVSVQWTQSTVSFVNYSEPKVIHMSEHLAYKELMLVFSHELGHVLGFPDCYLEFYEEKEKHSVYYDLDFGADNLMCDTHFGAAAPLSYLNQIKAGACRN